MPSVNRTTKIQSLYTALKKRHPRLPKAPERSVFLHLIYAACLENASIEAADKAMAILEEEFVDWNEVRVAAPSEIADTLPHLPEPLAAGERIKRALQAVFDSYYDFTLDELLKKPAAQAVQFFENFPAITPFMTAYIAQVALGSHVIPLDEASLRLFRLLDLTQVTPDRTREIVPTLERAITKADGVAFATMLHHLAVQFFDDPESTSLRQFLKPIDANSKNRSWIPPTLAPSKREPIRPARQEAIPSNPAHIVAQFTEDIDVPEESRHSVSEIEFIPYGIEGDVGDGPPKLAKTSKGDTKAPSVPVPPKTTTKTSAAQPPKTAPKKSTATSAPKTTASPPPATKAKATPKQSASQEVAKATTTTAKTAEKKKPSAIPKSSPPSPPKKSAVTAPAAPPKKAAGSVKATPPATTTALPKTAPAPSSPKKTTPKAPPKEPPRDNVKASAKAAAPKKPAVPVKSVPPVTKKGTPPKSSGSTKSPITKLRHKKPR